MALSLPSLDIINPHEHHQSFLLTGNPETFDSCFDTLPPEIFSFESNDCHNFASSMLNLNQIDQILAPNCNNSSPMQEFDTQSNMFDPNYFNNLIMSGIGDSMFGDGAQVLSHPIMNNNADFVLAAESPKQSRASQKRRIEGGELQESKKQCSTNRKTRVASPTKDTQSLAAKNRREKISERLRVLQELVPNGTKVDLVTMLEKAISYVKFLQLQVKVLETDDFWPSQGGNAPDITQVEQAIDAILASRKNNTNC